MAVRSSDGLPPVKNTGRKTGDARDLAAKEVGLGSGSDVNPGEKHHPEKKGKARDLAAKRVAEWRRQT